ncbi:replication protein A 70 kDa DNA-binding subunit-like [Neltuma alba]|uniref:replication protein A 70 kDa DNA-binding subunit-like n=1 Tax=Neltuma alba TaxID=207710 RepID=UPI0010A4FA66|nr:replication protein A 70 kDa DNA-binding subunit-like [Prosopis alba]
MSTLKISKLREVDDSTDRWRIVARVIRRWNVFNKDAPDEVFCISMLLVDEEGTRIQASVMNKSVFDLYEERPLEGRIYFIANFSVSANSKEYRATNHPYKITLGALTYIQEKNAPIPEYSYNFFPIAEILEVEPKNNIDYLIDVIGFVTSIGALEEYRVNHEVKNRVRLTLSDNLENSVSCVLFDECATEVCMTDFTRLEAPIVILIQLGRIGFDEDGKPEVCSSFHATKRKLMQEICGCDNAKTLPSPTISTISAGAPSQAVNASERSLLANHPLISISEIENRGVEDFFLIKCTVLKVDTRHGWNYLGCARCGSKSKTESGRLKVHYTVADDSGKATVVFFDKLAFQFLGKTANEMKLQLEKEDRGYDFPDELDCLVGKRLLLKIKLNKYNIDFPHSSISVSAYTEIVNLMEDFNRAGETTEEVPEEESNYVHVEEETPEDSGVADSQPVNDEQKGDDTEVLDVMPISQAYPIATYKGKRRLQQERVLG